MGRKLNISQPAVIQTELRPLDESFWIDANGGFEQWYYQNTNVFAPDRQITPLILTPHLSAVDLDTNTKYTPTFQLDSWVVKEYIDGAWVTTTITSQSQTADYVLQGLNLIVKKNNYDATHAINITCKATYQDPRDVGVLKGVEDSVMLVTSVDATQQFPKIDIVNPATRTYNPLKDESPIYEFEGKADWEGVEAQGGTAITECKVDPLGTEEIIPTNEEMIINSAPALNIHYGDIEKADQQFMYRQTANGEVSEIVGGVSAIDNIKGDTVKVVQLVQNGDFSNGSSGWASESTSYTTFTVNGGVMHITSTSSQYGVLQSPKIVNGHKYYLAATGKETESSTKYTVRLTSDVPKFTFNSTSFVRKSGIFTASSSSQKIIISSSSGSGDAYVKDVICLDLTAMGIDNLTTVEQVEAWLSTHIGNLDYIPYTEGKLVNYGGFSVKWNQMIDKSQATYTLNRVWAASTHHLSERANAAAVNYDKLFKQNHKFYFYTNIYLRRLQGIYGSEDSNYDDLALYTSNQPSSVIVTALRDYTSLHISIQCGQEDIGVMTQEIYDSCTFGFIDLTLMFGAGNEPDLDWCNKYLSRDYYPYCPSLDTNIMNVAEVKTAGFNKWDENWRNGTYNSSTGAYDSSTSNVCNVTPISVKPDTEYYAYCSQTLRICFYTENMTFISSNTYRKAAFTTPSNCAYINFHTQYDGTYRNDVCINLSDATRNGEYEPYHAQYKSPEMGVKTTGFNLWDEEWVNGVVNSNGDITSNNSYIVSVNKIPVIAGREYYLTRPQNSFGGINGYDSNGNYLGEIVFLQFNEHTYTIPTGCAFVRLVVGAAGYPITTYGNNICFNLSDPSRNGTYEPHWESFSDMSWITKIGIENFNIWDEEWEYGGLDAVGNDTDQYTNCVRQLGYTHITPSTDYHITSSVMCRIFFFDNNHQFISYVDKQNDLFTTPSNAKYLRFGTYAGTGSTYNHDICINLSIPHFNGRYCPHGETAPYFPNGLCNVGNVYDEVKVVGNKIKGVVRMGSVDLGTLNWILHSSGNMFADNATQSAGYQNGICSRYKYSNMEITGVSNLTEDKACVIQSNLLTRIVARDTAYTDAATFKSAMNGAMLYYELETPYEFEIDYPTKGQFMWYGVNGSGSEVPIDQLPIYSQATQPSGYGQGTSRININALYGENIPVILRVKRYPWSPTVLPPKVTKSVAWSIPPVDVVTTSDKGSAVRATNSSENFTFSTIVNQQGEIISDAKKTENMVFDWYMVKYGTSGAIKTSLGSGLTKAVAASTLKNTTPSGGVTPSTNIYCEAFLLGAYHLVDGQYVRTKD